MKIAIISIGCPIRNLEASRLREYFTLNHCMLTDDANDANTVIFITCIVIKYLENESLLLIEQFVNTGKKVIVMGCLPATHREFLLEKYGIKSIIPTEFDQIDYLFPSFTKTFKETATAYELFDSVSCNRRYDPNEFMEDKPLRILKFNALFSQKKYQRIIYLRKYFNDTIIRKGFLVISAGCNNRCTYCNIREAIGPMISKPQHKVINEYKEMLSAGYNFINIIAEDPGSYGTDIKSNLPELLDLLDKEGSDHKKKWALDGIHPQWLIKYKDSIIRHITKGNICEITVAIESGSERILQLMKRFYNLKLFEDSIAGIRKAGSYVKINCIFIVGFPSENGDDILKTQELLVRLKPDDVTLIRYSEFENRESAKIFPKVLEVTIDERINMITKTLKKLKTLSVR